jgi:hypothetical protein
MIVGALFLFGGKILGKVYSSDPRVWALTDNVSWIVGL